VNIVENGRSTNNERVCPQKEDSVKKCNHQPFLKKPLIYRFHES